MCPGGALTSNWPLERPGPVQPAEYSHGGEATTATAAELNTLYWTLDTLYWTLSTLYWTLDTLYVLDTGHPLLDIVHPVHCVLDTGHHVLDIVHSVLDTVHPVLSTALVFGDNCRLSPGCRRDLCSRQFRQLSTMYHIPSTRVTKDTKICLLDKPREDNLILRLGSWFSGLSYSSK